MSKFPDLSMNRNIKAVILIVKQPHKKLHIVPSTGHIVDAHSGNTSVDVAPTLLL